MRAKKQLATKMINIGFYGEGYEQRAEKFTDVMERDGIKYRFIQYHTIPTSRAAYGVWEKVNV